MSKEPEDNGYNIGYATDSKAIAAQQERAAKIRAEREAAREEAEKVSRNHFAR
jgi:hypothetical protein